MGRRVFLGLSSVNRSTYCLVTLWGPRLPVVVSGQVVRLCSPSLTNEGESVMYKSSIRLGRSGWKFYIGLRMEKINGPGNGTRVGHRRKRT